MTLAKDFASKAAVAFVALAMALSMFAPAAQAQSAEDMQKMINDLLAQIAALQGSTGGASAVAGVCPYTWTRDLSQGSTGADVKKLQQLLNSDPDTRVAASGVGSAGMETEYFGPATAAAVSKMQVKYRAEVLSPAGLVNPTGYFGAASRAKANALCAVTSGGSTTGGDTTGGSTTDDEDDDSSSLSGEADFSDASLDSASDDELEEGSEDAEVAELTVEFENGDAMITRIDVAFTASGEEKVWKTLEEVSLWVDGDMVASKSADAKSDYLGDEDNGVLRFSGLDIVAMEDEELDIVIAATLNSSIDDLPATWNVDVVGMRFMDADGISTTLNNADVGVDSVSFDIEEAGFEDEVIAKSSTNDPDAATLQVEDDKKSDWYTVFVFDLDTDDSSNDITINEIAIDLDLSHAYNVVVDDAELFIDGTRVDDFDVSSTTVTDPTLTFDVDGDVTIDAGDRVAAELKLRFKALQNEGTTVQASVDGTTIDAEGADDFDGEGAATGEVHTLRSTGIEVSLDKTTAEVTTSDGALNDYATYTIVLDVTAFEQDVYLPINAASTTWKLVDGNGNDLTVPTASTTAVITSSADEAGQSNAFYEIKEGSTEEVTLTVTFTPSIANTTARLQLVQLTFDETGTLAGGNDQDWDALPASTFRTAVKTIVN